MQTQCKDLKAQATRLKENLSNLLKSLSETSEQLQTNERRLSVKQSEIAGLQRDCEELRNNLSVKSEELSKLDALRKDNVTTNSIANPIAAKYLSLHIAEHTHWEAKGVG